MTIEKSANLRERTFDFSVSVIEVMKHVQKDMATRIIVNQFLRAATSIGANVAEAKGAGTKLDFKRFHEIALKSARECDYWLRLLEKTGYLDSAVSRLLAEELDQITAMLVSTVKSITHSISPQGSRLRDQNSL